MTDSVAGQHLGSWRLFTEAGALGSLQGRLGGPGVLGYRPDSAAGLCDHRPVSAPQWASVAPNPVSEGRSGLTRTWAQKEEQRGDLEGRTPSPPQQRHGSTGRGKGLRPGARLPPPSARLLSSLSTSCHSGLTLPPALFCRPFFAQMKGRPRSSPVFLERK